jgi:hypothetical protein
MLSIVHLLSGAYSSLDTHQRSSNQFHLLLAEKLGDALIFLQDRGEQIAQSPNPFEHFLWRKASWINSVLVQFCPRERGGDRWETE